MALANNCNILISKDRLSYVHPMNLLVRCVRPWAHPRRDGLNGRCTPPRPPRKRRLLRAGLGMRAVGADEVSSPPTP